MFELSNEQRKCFGLLPVDSNWTRMELKPSPYDHHITISYHDGTVLRKYIETGTNVYCEYEICEPLSSDLQFLLPKTEKGKPTPLSAAALKRRTGTGMCLSYDRRHYGYSYISLHSRSSAKYYYSSDYEPVVTSGIDDFKQWVNNWCSETSQNDLEDIARFAALPRQHVKFREGDVFRFKINRRLYGYGRILLNYALMRKKNEPFWDILMGKPLVCSVYHIVTERSDVSIDELKQLNTLPSVLMMDNRLFYGDYEIIGSISINEPEDYPIMYGNSIAGRDRAVMLQCGKLYRRSENATALFRNFTNNSIGFGLGFSLSVLQECITAGSNAPHWAQDNWTVNRDLRNPKFLCELKQICKQFDILPSQLIS